MLHAQVEGDRFALTPSKARLRNVRIIEDPVTVFRLLRQVPTLSWRKKFTQVRCTRKL
jgi:hypothetical protein